jgi:hypothetical protein
MVIQMIWAFKQQTVTIYSNSGWWFGTFFSPIIGMMIQSDFHIFRGGGSTTN